MSRHDTVTPSFIAPILDLLPDAIIWTRPVLNKSGEVEDFEVGYSNKPADEGINHPRGSLSGLRILRDGIPSVESARSNFNHFLEVYLTGEIKEFSFFAHHAGRQFETIRRIYAGGVLSTTRDRKAQREAEQKEQEKPQLLNGIIDNAPIGIQVYEAVRDERGTISDFKIKLYNDVLHELTGITKEERIRLSFKQLLASLQSDELFCRYVNTVETGQPFSFDYQSPRRNRWLHLSVVKLGTVS